MLAALLVWALTAQAGAGIEEDVEAVLSAMPSGTEAERAAWLHRTARETVDAQLALRLMDEVIRRFETHEVRHARLWKVRYLMAAGDTAAAAHELRAVRGSPEAPTRTQEAYWAARLGRAGLQDEGTPRAELPPWDLMGRIAGLGGEEGGRRRERAALELEGAARRWGLLGPWLRELAASEDPTLVEAARRILASPGIDLSASPYLPAVRAHLAAYTGEGPPVPEPEPPREEAVTTPATFAVRVGTFEDPSAARGLVRELASHGFPARVVRVAEPGSAELYEVLLGRGCRLSEAESLGVALGEVLMLSYQIVAESQDGPRGGFDRPVQIADPNTQGEPTGPPPAGLDSLPDNRSRQQDQTQTR